MKRTAGITMLLAALGGCVTTGDGTYTGGAGGSCCGTTCGGGHCGPTVPGVQGPYGQPVAMAAPYSYSPPSGKDAAMAMLQNSVPMDVVQQAAYKPGSGSGILQAQATLPGAVMHAGGISPPGVPMTPGAPGGSGIQLTGGGSPPGAVAAVGALTGGNAMPGQYAPHRTEVRFVGPNGMKISVPVAIDPFKRPTTSPRRAVNQREAITAASWSAVRPGAMPSNTPNPIHISTRLVMKAVSTKPPIIRPVISDSVAKTPPPRSSAPPRSTPAYIA